MKSSFTIIWGDLDATFNNFCLDDTVESLESGHHSFQKSVRFKEMSAL